MRNSQHRAHAAARAPKLYFRGCEGKKRHPSKHAAMGILRALLYRAYDGERPDKYGGWTQEQYIAYLKGLEPYKCRLCGGYYHLGHSWKETV